MKKVVSVVMLAMLTMGVFGACGKVETPVAVDSEVKVETPVVEEPDGKESEIEEPPVDLPYTYRITEEMSKTFEEKEKNTEPGFVNYRDMNMSTDGELTEKDIEIDDHQDMIYDIIAGVYGFWYQEGLGFEEMLSGTRASILHYLVSDELYEESKTMWEEYYGIKTTM